MLKAHFFDLFTFFTWGWGVSILIFLIHELSFSGVMGVKDHFFDLSTF